MNTLLDPSFIKKCPMDALRDGLSAVAALTMIFDAPDVGGRLNGEDRRWGVNILLESAYGTLRAAYDVLDEEAADEYLRQKRGEVVEQDAFNRRADAWMMMRNLPSGIREDVTTHLNELRQLEENGVGATLPVLWDRLCQALASGAIAARPDADPARDQESEGYSYALHALACRDLAGTVKGDRGEQKAPAPALTEAAPVETGLPVDTKARA